ncbi:hypothetical protein MY04_4572 [Flammeovirga sp. MY04]|uniref:hypothetical protein n=1 Tax=Flammeovirga sp. MY04 TaxID=1191459 RepID=UPI00080637ED|nr:hypothetical protein [Flammeovirga sp. MY04]ANQ51907.1 hypothetical protein MY04_4572 [Flammeovirga sp. MY04]
MKHQIIKIIIFVFLFSCNEGRNYDDKIYLIVKSIHNVKEIEYSSDNPNYALEGVVHLGGSLYMELLEMSEEGFIDHFIIKKGDVFYDKDNIADYHLIIMSKKRKIAIRLRYDEIYKKFHIIGYVEVI